MTVLAISVMSVVNKKKLYLTGKTTKTQGQFKLQSRCNGLS